MQMNPLLQNLIEQYYGSVESLPPDMAQFLQTVNNLFASVSIESGAGHSSAAPAIDIKEIEAAAEAPVTLLQEYTDILANAKNEEEIYNTLISFLGNNFGFDQARFFKFNPETNGLSVAAAYSDNPNQNGTASSMGSVRAAADSRQTLFTGSDPLTSQQTEISIPLSARGNLIGVLNASAESDDHLNGPTRKMLEVLAAQTSMAVASLSNQSAVRVERVEVPAAPAASDQTRAAFMRDVSSLQFHQYGYDPNLRTAVPLDDRFNIPVEQLPNKPLEVQGQVIGAFGIQTSEDEPLTAEERALLESISEEVSQALERAHLFETSQRSAAELAVLNEMGSLFSEALEEEKIVEGIFTYTSKLIEVPQFYVAYYDEDSDTISFPKVVINGEEIKPGHPSAENFRTRPAGTGLTGYIIKNRRPILIEKNAEEVLEELGIPYQRFGGETQSWLGVPMTMGDQVLGVITIQCDNKAGLYNQHHVDLLSTIASQAAVALNNIRLFQQEQERAEQERLVRTITDKVRRGATTQAILEIAIEELSRVLNADLSAIQLGTPDQLVEEPQQLSQSPPLPETTAGAANAQNSGLSGTEFEEEV